MSRIIPILFIASLFFASCSKENVSNEETEGINAIAQTVGSAKNNNSSITGIWFQRNQGRMYMRLDGNIGTLPTDCRPNGTLTYKSSSNKSSVSSSTAPLCRLGNSKMYRSDRNTFNINPDNFFSLVDFKIDLGIVNGTEKIETGSLFLYPSGRTVEQNPTIRRGIIGDYTFDDSHTPDQSNFNLSFVISDDPAQEVESIKFANSVGEFDLNKTHFNQNLGLSRWTGPGRSGAGSSASFGGEVYLMGSGNYDVDFLDEKQKTEIVAKYDVRIPVVWHVLNSAKRAPLEVEENDDPVFLGTALRSKTGGSWKYEVAIADLGDWVESASATITYSDPKGFKTTERQFDLQLVRTEGNLKVFQADRLILEGLEFGTEVEALVSGFGRGTRIASGRASNRAELL